MRSSVLLTSCLTLALVHFVLVDESRAILTKDKGRAQYQAAARKVSINPHIYKYLRGYYQNDKTAQASAPRRQALQIRKPVLAESAKEQSAAKAYGSAYLNPKSGLQSGRYRFAQSPNYIQKLKRLAAILRARAAARAQRKAPTQGYSAVRKQPLASYQKQQKPQLQQQNVQRSAPRRYASQPSYVAQQPRQYAPQLSPQLSPPAPQPSYGAPRAPASQQSYPQPSQNPSFHSLGLPRGQTYQLPAPVTTPRPSQKINTDALVKLLKASYASLMPLLLNQVRMTSYGVQRIPLYGSNPYSVFGPMTYGPLPKPNLSQMTLTYNPSTFASAQTRPISGYSSNSVPQQQQQTGYGGSLYSSGPQNTGYSSSQSYDISPDATCGLVSDLFCHGRTAGLYSHPASGHCFVQCDHVGHGTARSCSPGTRWKALGPEPALFNYCS